MCGIVGYTGSRRAKSILIEGLEKLEYRGYDSAGVAINNGELKIIKSAGNISALKGRLPDDFEGSTGIAHTRWATHGKPNEDNAHPHRSMSGNLVMVHNGIIENTEELRKELAGNNYVFSSETDTEVLLNLIDMEYMNSGKDILTALRKALSKAEGSYAAVIMESGHPEELVVCRHGSPLVIGFDTTGTYVSSDIYAISEHTSRFVFPENGDIVLIDSKGIKKACTVSGFERKLEEKRFVTENMITGKNGYEHYMFKEICEQPSITGSLAHDNFTRYNTHGGEISVDDFLNRIERITILGCGTSWHAGLIGKYVIEKFLRIPVNAEYASEYRYRHPVITSKDLVITISQSGETADTLAANRLARESGAMTLGIINVRNSTLERETDFQVYINAGPEIGVASTKAYTAQVVTLYLLTSHIADLKGDHKTAVMIAESLKLLPDAMSRVIESAGEIERLAGKYSSSNNFLFLGRGLNYPSALEGALKLKEISYIHAEGYPGAEMKHGPIALIDYHFPTLAIMTDSENQSKMKSNIEEIRARSGKVIAFIPEGMPDLAAHVEDKIEIPALPDILTPVLTAVPLQLFAYYVALQRGCNVDQPRNLAKSVTVE